MVTVRVATPVVAMVLGTQVAVAPGIFCTPSKLRFTLPLNANGVTTP